MDKMERMREIIAILKPAAKAYYGSGEEIMTNFEWDALTDELRALEDETGVTLAESPTLKVEPDPDSALKKVEHSKPMLSLDKTKDREALAEKAGDKDAFLSWKMDGITIVLQYDGGRLTQAVTRGNGKIGEDITQNAMRMKGVPLRIPEADRKVIRGEATITYSEFNRVNSELPEGQEPYKNPRNLCAGTMRSNDPQAVSDRGVGFHAFDYVEGSTTNSHYEGLCRLSEMGFGVVEGELLKRDQIVEAVGRFEQKVKSYDEPTDGLVLVYDDIAYGLSLGTTGKFPRKGLAFKWADEQAETTVRNIDWSVSRTSLINPVVEFDTVELEGSEVSRASLHNVSILKQMKIGIGDRIKVFKANMIIPQVSENITKTGPAEVPSTCPVCGAPTELAKDPTSGCETLRCTGSGCVAKQVTAIDHYCSRDAMNIMGMSEKTIEVFFREGILHSITDLYRLRDHKDAITALDKFGDKKYANMIEAIEASRGTEAHRLLYAVGVPGFGLSNCEALCGAIEITSPLDFPEVTREDMDGIEGIGDKMKDSYIEFFSNPKNQELMGELSTQVSIVKKEKKAGGGLEGLTFVITGSLERLSRKELTEAIKARGGKVAGSVSAKTTALINNDVASNSSKNRTAKELGVRIISEADFYDEYDMEG